MLTIGLITFKSQKLAKDHVRSLILRYAHNEPVKNYEDIDFLNHLVKRHSEAGEKIGVGIKFFISIRDFTGNPALKLIRVDLSETDISWVHCVTQRKKQEIDIALRTAINPQIWEFKKQQNFICELCKEPAKEVDHHFPTFSELKKEFLYGKENIPQSFDEDGITNMACFKKEDQEFKILWQNFHRQKAKLRAICYECHKEVTAKQYR